MSTNGIIIAISMALAAGCANLSPKKKGDDSPSPQPTQPNEGVSATPNGNEVGNGGDVVVCRDGNALQSAELLDFYEGRTLRGLVPSLGDPAVDPRDKAIEALNRLDAFDPGRAAQYKHAVATFAENAAFVPNTDLPPIDDTGSLILARGCRIEQAVIQRKPEVPHDKRYIISQELWDALSNDGKAGLILHEIVYKDALERGHRSSRHVRYFTTLIASADLGGLDAAGYEEMLFAIRMAEYFDLGGYREAAGHSQSLRYFPDRLMTLPEARDFCLRLGATVAYLSAQLQIEVPMTIIYAFLAQDRKTRAEPRAMWLEGTSFKQEKFNTITTAVPPEQKMMPEDTQQEVICHSMKHWK